MESTQPAVDTLNYEQAFAELEEITRLMEENPPALESALALFERGQALAKHCATLLDQAELKVHQLTGDEISGLQGDEQA